MWHHVFFLGNGHPKVNHVLLCGSQSSHTTQAERIRYGHLAMCQRLNLCQNGLTLLIIFDNVLHLSMSYQGTSLNDAKCQGITNGPSSRRRSISAPSRQLIDWQINTAILKVTPLSWRMKIHHRLVYLRGFSTESPKHENSNLNNESITSIMLLFHNALFKLTK